MRSVVRTKWRLSKHLSDVRYQCNLATFVASATRSSPRNLVSSFLCASALLYIACHHANDNAQGRTHYIVSTPDTGTARRKACLTPDSYTTIWYDHRTPIFDYSTKSSPLFIMAMTIRMVSASLPIPTRNSACSCHAQHKRTQFVKPPSTSPFQTLCVSRTLLPFLLGRSTRWSYPKARLLS